MDHQIGAKDHLYDTAEIHQALTDGNGLSLGNPHPKSVRFYTVEGAAAFLLDFFLHAEAFDDFKASEGVLDFRIHSIQGFHIFLLRRCGTFANEQWREKLQRSGYYANQCVPRIIDQQRHQAYARANDIARSLGQQAKDHFINFPHVII